MKRWKRKSCSCAQPGLLTYNTATKRGRKVTGGSINLHDAIINIMPEDPRCFRIQTPTGIFFHLRVIDADDLEACVADIRVPILIFILVSTYCLLALATNAPKVSCKLQDSLSLGSFDSWS